MSLKIALKTIPHHQHAFWQKANQRLNYFWVTEIMIDGWVHREYTKMFKTLI